MKTITSTVFLDIAKIQNMKVKTYEQIDVSYTREEEMISFSSFTLD